MNPETNNQGHGDGIEAFVIATATSGGTENRNPRLRRHAYSEATENNWCIKPGRPFVSIKDGNAGSQLYLRRLLPSEKTHLLGWQTGAQPGIVYSVSVVRGSRQRVMRW